MLNEQYTSRVDFIIDSVSQKMGVDKENLFSGSRRQDVLTARRMVAVLCREYTMATYKEISKLVGRRDHSTIINSVRVHDDLMHTDKRYVDLFNDIADAVRNSGWGRPQPVMGYTLSCNDGCLYGFYSSYKRALEESVKTGMSVVCINHKKLNR